MSKLIQRGFPSALALWLTLTPSQSGTLIRSNAASAQERPADNAVASQINDGVEKARDGKLLDAIEQFQRVIDTSGNELVPAGNYQQLPARWVVHGHLSRLPAAGLKLYRQRVDGQGMKRLEEAKKSRDDLLLERLLGDMFAATANEETILELARRAFERGEFDAAEHYWHMLLPAQEGDTRLHFPQPKIDIAAVKARLVMLKLFQGEREEAKAELIAFREKYAEAAGLLAGKTAKYVDTLAELLRDPAKTTLPPAPDEPGWPMFAGRPSRLGTLRTKLPYFWPDVAEWRTPLPFLRSEGLRGLPEVPHPRSLAFFPVISNGRGYIADGKRVVSIDLMSGRMSRVAELPTGEDVRIPTKQDVRFTLTEHEGLLYARFGASGLRGEGNSFLVALGERKPGTEERVVLWKLDPPAEGEAKTHFEGAPVIHDDCLYVAFWRQAAGEAVAGIACYRMDDPKTLPELGWQRIVGKAGSEPNGETRYRHALVTISGANVVYCTDGGSVVALNANDGKPAWEYRYPPDERPTMPRYRDLCPPLADGGRVYAAPADTGRLLCLDAYTGRLIWEREGVEVVHLLGVSQGRLIATFAGQVRGIRGLNLRTGADSGENGWTIHDDGGESTFGRGLVTEQAVVWPTKHGLHFLNPADGSPLRSPIRGAFGNLTYADGVLLVTTPTEVWGYSSETNKLGDRRGGLERRPAFPLASGNEPIARFDQVRAVGGRLFGRLSDSKLVSLDCFGGVSWQVDASTAGREVPFEVTFDPSFFADDTYVVAHTSSGKVTVLDSATGRPLALAKSTRKSWPTPPAAVGRGRVLWPEDGSLVLFDAKAGKELSRYRVPDPETLSGELPRFRIHQGDPLLIIDRNHGVEVDRLKIDGLQRVWKHEAILVGRELDDVAFSGEEFFVAAENTLIAYTWKDGERQWEVPLPEVPHAKWKVTVAPQGLLVHPAKAIPLRPDVDPAPEVARAGLNWPRLIGAMRRSYDVWSARELPILVVDPADGRLIQRLNFPAAGPAAGVAATPKGVEAVTGKGSWTLAPK
jgi:outer membrane protein assembly factor BamB